MESLEVRTLLAAGDVDPSFVGDITRPVVFNTLNAGYRTSVVSAAFQADGKIVIAAYGEAILRPYSLLTRVLPSGELDTTFGVNGQVKFAEEDYARKIDILPDQKILFTTDRFVRRLLPDGSLDSTFSGDGTVEFERGLRTAIDPRDTDPASGSRLIVLNYKTLRRLLPDGTPDTTFGTGGQVDLGFWPNGMAVQPDGSIVFGIRGDSEAGLADSIVRYRSDGTPDPTFGSGGRFERPFPYFSRSILSAPNGDLYVSENGATSGTQTQWQIYRLTKDGSLDKTFGQAGFLSPLSSCSSMAFLPDNRFIVGGIGGEGNPSEWSMVCYTRDGMIDTSFGINGVSKNSFDATTRSFFFSGLTVDPQNSAAYVIGTVTGPRREFNRYTGVMAKVLTSGQMSGQLDTTFDHDGRLRVVEMIAATVPLAGPSPSVTDSLNRTVFVSGHESMIRAVRYNPDGSLDNSFGNGGLAATFLSGSGSHEDFEVRSVALSADGGILIAGRGAHVLTDGTPADGFILKLKSNGDVDRAGGSGYGSDGVLRLKQFSRIAKLLPLRDGKILVAGDGVARTPDGALARDPVILRLDENGTELGGFPTGGDKVAEKSVFGFVLVDVVEAPDGKFIALGNAGVPGLVRWFGNGTIDQGFERIRRFAITTSGYEFPDRVLVRPNGKVLVLTHLRNDNGLGASSWLKIRQYNEDGTDDRTFGNSNGETTVFGSPPDIELLPDGSILLVESRIITKYPSFYEVESSSSFVYRLDPNGIPDQVWNSKTPGMIPGYSASLDLGVLGHPRIVLSAVEDPGNFPYPTRFSRIRVEIGPGVQVLSKKSILTTTESGTTATFEVRLSSKPTANVMIPVTSSDPTEGTVSVSSLTFTPDNWSVAQTVTITGVDDALFDADQRYRILLGPATSADADYDGKTVKPVEVRNRDDETLRFFRTFNPQANFHFFTTSVSEFQGVQPNGYNDESSGRGGFSLAATQTVGFTQLFRLYNLEKGFHYYTASAAERDALLALNPPQGDPNFGKVGWRFEGSPGFIADTQQSGTSQVFRLYNRTSGTHLFTENPAVKATVLQLQGWEEHAPLGFAFLVDDAAPPTPSPTPVPPAPALPPASMSATAEAAGDNPVNVASLVAVPQGSRSTSPPNPAASEPVSESSSTKEFGDEPEVAALDAFLESWTDDLVSVDV